MHSSEGCQSIRSTRSSNNISRLHEDFNFFLYVFSILNSKINIMSVFEYTEKNREFKKGNCINIHLIQKNTT